VAEYLPGAIVLKVAGTWRTRFLWRGRKNGCRGPV